MDDYDITKDEVESLKELASLDGAAVPILAQEEYEKEVSKFKNFGEERAQEELSKRDEKEINGEKDGSENSSLESGENSEKSADNSINGNFDGEKDENNQESQETKTEESVVKEDNKKEDLEKGDTIPKKSDSMGTAAKVFGVSSEQLEAEFLKQKADKLFKKIELMLCDPFMSENEIMKRAKEAKDLGLSQITVFPALVKKVKALTAGAIAVGTSLAYPFGADSVSTIKYAIKNALKLGADVIEVPFSHYDICQKKPKVVAKIYEKYRKLCKTKKFVLVCEIAKMTPNEIEELGKIINFAGIKSVKTSAGLEGAVVDEYVLPTFKKSLLPTVEITVCEHTGKGENAIRAFNVGADKYASVNAGAIARAIKEDLNT